MLQFSVLQFKASVHLEYVFNAKLNDMQHCKKKKKSLRNQMGFTLTFFYYMLTTMVLVFLLQLLVAKVHEKQESKVYTQVITAD